MSIRYGKNVCRGKYILMLLILHAFLFVNDHQQNVSAMPLSNSRNRWQKLSRNLSTLKQTGFWQMEAGNSNRKSEKDPLMAEFIRSYKNLTNDERLLTQNYRRKSHSGRRPQRSGERRRDDNRQRSGDRRRDEQKKQFEKERAQKHDENEGVGTIYERQNYREKKERQSASGNWQKSSHRQRNGRGRKQKNDIEPNLDNFKRNKSNSRNRAKSMPRIEKNDDRIKQRYPTKSKSKTQTTRGTERCSKSAGGARQSTSSISKYIKAKKKAESTVNGAEDGEDQQKQADYSTKSLRWNGGSRTNGLNSSKCSERRYNCTYAGRNRRKSGQQRHHRSLREKLPNAARGTSSSRRSGSRSRKVERALGIVQSEQPIEIDKVCTVGGKQIRLGLVERFQGEKSEYWKQKKLFEEGGQGTLFYAFSLEMDKCVALKIVNLRTMNRAERMSAENEMRIIRHIMQQKQCGQQKYEHIVEYYEIFQENDKIYMIMELGDTDLREYSKKVLNVLEDGNEEKNDKIEHILRNILKAFVELHNKAGIVHLDFKLANAILLHPKTASSSTKSADFNVKMIDFGASMRTQSNGSNSQEIERLIRVKPNAVLTLHYAAPEQCLDIEVSVKADIWSLGVVLVNLLTSKAVNANMKFFLIGYSQSNARLDKKIPLKNYQQYLYEKKMEQFGRMVKKYIFEDNEPLWLIALACLHPNPHRRPMAFQLLAFMHNRCVLFPPSMYASSADLHERTYNNEDNSNEKLDKPKKDCAKYTLIEFERDFN